MSPSEITCKSGASSAGGRRSSLSSTPTRGWLTGISVSAKAARGEMPRITETLSWLPRRHMIASALHLHGWSVGRQRERNGKRITQRNGVPRSQWATLSVTAGSRSRSIARPVKSPRAPGSSRDTTTTTPNRSRCVGCASLVIRGITPTRPGKQPLTEVRCQNSGYFHP